jgi:deoxyadenosine/deoxycytidine kinase
MSPRCIVVEGNIGAGKSTVLRRIEALGFKVFYENVERWKPLLELFYKDPSRWSFALQVAILHDMCQQRIDADKVDSELHPVVFFERSPASNMIFAKISGQLGTISKIELETYNLLYKDMSWTPDVTVLVDTPVAVCMERIRRRNREGEQGIDVKYLESVDGLHRTDLGVVGVVVDGTTDTVTLANSILSGVGLFG